MLLLPMRAVAPGVRPGIGHPDPNARRRDTEADMYASAARPPNRTPTPSGEVTEQVDVTAHLGLDHLHGVKAP